MKISYLHIIKITRFYIKLHNGSVYWNLNYLVYIHVQISTGAAIQCIYSREIASLVLSSQIVTNMSNDNKNDIYSQPLDENATLRFVLTQV